MIPPLEIGVQEFGTPRADEEYRSGGCGIIIDTETQRYAVYRLPSGLTGFFAGGVEDGEDMQEGVLREVREESGLYDFEEVEFIARARAQQLGWDTATDLVTLKEFSLVHPD